MKFPTSLSLLVATTHTAMASPAASAITGIVSTSWLAAQSSDPSILVIDTRPADAYAAGHIAKAVNIPFVVPVSAWISFGPDELLLQLPTNDTEFFRTLSAAGVSRNRRIIISSTKATPPFPQAEAARVAWTMALAGFEKVHLLNGGMAQWQAEGRPVTTIVPRVTPTGIRGSLDRTDVVDREYVKAAINKKIILDARDPSVYNGSVLEEWAQKPGHIESAKNLPTVSLLDSNGNYKDKAALKALVESVIGRNVMKNTEIIVHCGVGGYAGAVYWVLQTVLGYTNIKFYDGAAQDWVRYYDFVV